MTVVTNNVNSCLAVQYQWKVWNIMGLQFPKRESKWLTPYIAYAIILHASILFLPTSFIINLILSNNMTELCENICYTTTSVACTIKFFYVIAVRHNLIEVGKILKHLDARAQTYKQVAILEEGIASARKLFIVFELFCFALGCCAQILIFISGGSTLAYPTFIPWNWTASKKVFLLTHAYIFYCTTLQTLQNVVNDTYPPAYLIILSSQINALALRIKDLGNKSTSSEDILYGKLKECIRDHNTIHRLFLTIQKSISTTCLIQFAATGLSQCTMGVYVLYIGIQPAKMLHCFAFFVAITIEIFILCYYGELYCQANDHLTESIYACNWMDREKRFKKAILFLLQRSQKSSAIMVGVLIPVRLPTFVQILKTAYSVFTVLNNANAN